MPTVIDDPILNRPFVEPGRHWFLDERGIPTGVIEQGRRRSEYIVPVQALSADFRKMAEPEIETSKSDLRQRGKHAEAEALTDSDLLREVMNTVGQVGRLGEHLGNCPQRHLGDR